MIDKKDEQPKEPKVHKIINSVDATLGFLVAIVTFILTFRVR